MLNIKQYLFEYIFRTFRLIIHNSMNKWLMNLYILNAAGLKRRLLLSLKMY